MVLNYAETWLGLESQTKGCHVSTIMGFYHPKLKCTLFVYYLLIVYIKVDPMSHSESIQKLNAKCPFVANTFWNWKKSPHMLQLGIIRYGPGL